MPFAARSLLVLAAFCWLCGCRTESPPVASTPSAVAPLTPSPRLIVGRVLATDAAQGFAFVELAPDAPAAAFIDNLPGFPDNLSFNGKDKFWVALYAPRDPLLDATLPYPWARKIIARIPSFLQPKPKKHAWVVSVNLDGKIVDDLQYAGANAYSPITSVEQTPDALVFGSLTAPSMAKIAWPAPKP